MSAFNIPSGSHSTWSPVAAIASWRAEVQAKLHNKQGTILPTTAQGPTSRVGRTEGARKQDPCRPHFQQALQDTPAALAPQRAALDSQPTSRKCSPSKADGMDSRIPILRALSSHRKRRLPARPCRTACRASPHSSSSSSAASRPCSQRQATRCGAVHCFAASQLLQLSCLQTLCQHQATGVK